MPSQGSLELRRVHFQCYQYNAFLCLDLIRHYELTRDTDSLALVPRLLDFLATGVAPNGHAFYACGNVHRAVTYHASAVGAALLCERQRWACTAYDAADRRVRVCDRQAASGWWLSVLGRVTTTCSAIGGRTPDTSR